MHCSWQMDADGCQYVYIYIYLIYEQVEHELQRLIQ